MNEFPKRGRGRPRTFQFEDRQKLAELISAHGIRGTKSVSKVSLPTLIKIAREFGVTLKIGKRKKAA